MALQALIQSLAHRASVPGVSIAVIRHGEVAVTAAGIRDIVGRESVNAQTVFDVASLSKPMMAYAVLQLADRGALNLDEPLSRYVPPIVPDDTAAVAITARHILAHTSGLPNLRGKETLRIHFAPGARFSYSSVGFTYLQSAIEAATGESLEPIMKQLVFEPLNMMSSSFIWQPRFVNNAANPHEGGARIEKHHPQTANASYSLQTTAADYGSFMAAVLKGDRLKPATFSEWLTPAVNVPSRSATNLEREIIEMDAGVAWGLGWGLEPTHSTFFQWGKMPGVRAFVMGSTDKHAGIVVFTNSNTGLRLIDEVTRTVLPGDHPAFKWLEACVSE